MLLSKLRLVGLVLAALSVCGNLALGLYAHHLHGELAASMADCNTALTQAAKDASDAARQAQADADAITIKQLKALTHQQADALAVAQHDAEQARDALNQARAQAREVYRNDPSARAWRDELIPAGLLDGVRPGAGGHAAGNGDDYAVPVSADPGAAAQGMPERAGFGDPDQRRLARRQAHAGRLGRDLQRATERDQAAQGAGW